MTLEEHTFKNTTVWICHFAFTSSLDPISLGRFFRSFWNIKVFHLTLRSLQNKNEKDEEAKEKSGNNKKEEKLTMLKH